MPKLRVGILGATGMVGQKFLQLLDNHPWFEVATVADSERLAHFFYFSAKIFQHDDYGASKNFIISSFLCAG